MGKVSGALLIALVAFVFTRGIYPSPVRAHEQTQTNNAQAVPPANGLADASGLVAEALDKIKAKHVAIFDFYSPGDRSWDAIGRQIGADFRTRVDATPHKFRLEPYADIAKRIESDGFWQIDLSIADVAAFAIHDDKVDAFVTGSLTPTTSDTIINFRLFVYNIKKPGSPTMVTTSTPFTPELKAMKGMPEQPATIKLPPYNAGNGVTYPSCLYCPQAEYTQTAVDKKFQGMVTMEAVIQANGKAGAITILKGLPYGLDAAAVAAVRKWRFQPALGPDGKPAAVRQTIEVQFHLY